MATQIEEFIETKTGGFLAGIGVVLLAAIAWRAAPTVVLVATAKPVRDFTAREVASWIVRDVAIGRVPLLEAGTPVTIVNTVLTVFTTSFYLFQGGHLMVETGKEVVGIPIKGTGRPDEDSVAGPSPFQILIAQRSESGRITSVVPNGARRDP